MKACYEGARTLVLHQGCSEGFRGHVCRSVPSASLQRHKDACLPCRGCGEEGLQALEAELAGLVQAGLDTPLVYLCIRGDADAKEPEAPSVSNVKGLLLLGNCYLQSP